MRSLVFKRDELKYFRFLLICFLLFTVTTSLYSKEFNKYDRIYALSNIWKEMSYSYAFPDKLFGTLNTDSLYKCYLPLLEKDMDYYDFYKILSSYISHFNDGHTRILVSSKIVDTPPVFTTLVEDKVVINNVAKDLEKDIPIGSEVIKVNGIDVDDYIRDSVFVYISASTERFKWNKSVLELLRGRTNSAVTVTIKSYNGKERDVKLIRNYEQIKKEIQLVNPDLPINVRFIGKKKNISYIKLSSFLYGNKNVIDSTFLSNIKNIRNSKGLIIDLRENRGGSDASWNMIADYLLKEKEYTVPVKAYSRKYIPAYIEFGKYIPELNDFTKGTAMEEIKYSNYINKVADSLKLEQPLIILTGKYCGSSTENFIMLMKYVKKALIIGETTAACCSSPKFYSINDFLGFQISSVKYVLLDGTQPNDVGITPDINIREEYKDYCKGYDRALMTALEKLDNI